MATRKLDGKLLLRSVVELYRAMNLPGSSFKKEDAEKGLELAKKAWESLDRRQDPEFWPKGTVDESHPELSLVGAFEEKLRLLTN